MSKEQQAEIDSLTAALKRQQRVVELAWRWNEAWLAGDAVAAEQALTRLSMMLTALAVEEK